LKNPYDVLGVSSECSEADLRATYHRLAVQFHPDKPTGDAERFKEISAAYQHIRRLRDAGEAFSDMFRSAGWSRRDIAYPKDDHFVIVTLRLSVAEVKQGKAFEVSYFKSVDCDSCKGRGCTLCDARGTKVVKETITAHVKGAANAEGA
jgi:DnaJ-class molecular chaperone